MVRPEARALPGDRRGDALRRALARATLLLTVCAVSLPVPDARADALGPLRVVTFNLFHGGPWSAWGDDHHLEHRLAMTARELAALDVDLVGVQEASTGRRRGHVAARLAATLGHGHVFTSATSRIVPLRSLGVLIRAVHGFHEGPAILSRLPIVGSAVYDLPRCAGLLNARVLLEAEVEAPGGRLRVYSTHAEPCQYRRVAEIVHARRTALPSILFGDLNDTPDAPATAVLREAGFVDAFAVANPGDPGLTDWQRPGAPAPTVFQRVDYVLVLPGTAATVRVLESRVILDEPDVDPTGAHIWPSDHYGLFAALEMVPLAETGPAGRAALQ